MTSRRTSILMVGALTIANGTGHSATPAGQAEQAGKICQMVVSAERGAKPYKLCLSRADWDAKKVANAKNANRMVCHYQDRPGTKFRSSKVCMTAAEWTNERLRNRQAVEQIQMRSCVPGGGC